MSKVGEVHHYHHRLPSPGIAVLLELLPGVFLHTFGVGNIYAGKVARGILIMLLHWVLVGVNVLLCYVVVGFITWPLTWLAFAVGSTMSAHRAAVRASRRS